MAQIPVEQPFDTYTPGMAQMGEWRVAAPTILLLAALALSGCGDQEADEAVEDSTASASSTPSGASEGSAAAPPDAPDCSEVWADGSELPRFYQGCVDEAGSYVERDSLSCSSGQRMVRYDDRYYGVLGGTVHEAARALDDDRDYIAAVRSCRA